MEDRITRRRLLGGLLAAPLGNVESTCFAGPDDGCRQCRTPRLEKSAYQVRRNRLSIDLSAAAQLDEVGGSARIEDDQLAQPVLLVHLEPDRYLAISGACTHGGVEVTYHRRKHLLTCTSINRSIYDVEGDVLRGPAPRPLPRFRVEKRDGMLLIDLS